MKTLNVIGCGKVGKTLSRLWARQGVFEVRSVLNRSLASGWRAVEFIEGGHAVGELAQMQRADVFMISASDESIEQCCRELCAAGLLRAGTIVFHCSGSLPSSVLEPARAQGASIASIHPVKSFADPAIAAETFAGTFCALEGDREASELLREAFRQCAAVTFPVDPRQKTIHHVATVMVSNYLVALIEVGLRCFERAGLPREDAMKVIVPIVTGVLSNVFRLGTVEALSGPIARGEQSVVEGHCRALAQWDADILQAYRSLGRVALDLSAAQGQATPEVLAAIRGVLASVNHLG